MMTCIPLVNYYHIKAYRYASEEKIRFLTVTFLSVRRLSCRHAGHAARARLTCGSEPPNWATSGNG